MPSAPLATRCSADTCCRSNSPACCYWRLFSAPPPPPPPPPPGPADRPPPALFFARRRLPRPAPAREAAMTVGLTHFLMLGAVLFTSGIITVLTKRHAVGILMGVELMLNAANLNLVALDRFAGTAPHGQVFALFVI